jgi:hypothetical protein
VLLRSQDAVACPKRGAADGGGGPAVAPFMHVLQELARAGAVAVGAAVSVKGVVEVAALRCAVSTSPADLLAWCGGVVRAVSSQPAGAESNMALCFLGFVWHGLRLSRCCRV